MIQRVINPMMAYMLIPWYITTWESEAEVCTRVYNMLFLDPQDTFIGAELNDDQTIKGIVIASKQGEDMEIGQMNNINAKALEGQLTDWGRSRGCKQMVIYTYRNPRAFERAHGFKIDVTETVNGSTRYKMSRRL